MLKFLIENGGKVEGLFAHQTLYTAVRSQNLEAIEYLVKTVGISPEAKDFNGFTVLESCAKTAENVKILEYFELLGYNVKTCRILRKSEGNGFFCGFSGEQRRMEFTETLGIVF